MVYATTLTAPAFALRRQIDRLLEESLGHGHAGQGDWVPAVDICETERELTFSVELPGVRLEDVEVTAVEGILTIHGARTAVRSEGEEERYHLVERSYGSFLRRFQPPAGRGRGQDRGRRHGGRAPGAHPQAGTARAEADSGQGSRGGGHPAVKGAR